jgi:hypothetical protein
MAIGSYLSQTVVILRTRPKIQFESKIDFIGNGTFLEKLRRDTQEFVLRACTRILTSKFGSVPNNTFGKAVTVLLQMIIRIRMNANQLDLTQ